MAAATELEKAFKKAIDAASERKITSLGGAVHDRATAKLLGSAARGIIAYRAFHELTPEDQARARASYPHKSVGAKYDFRDEHYYYPIDKHGRLFNGRGARRVLAFSNKAITSGEIEKFGYTKNPGW